MREYTIKLSEEEIKKFEIYASCSQGNYKIIDVILNKIEQAKQKPYTNFDKMKDSISIFNAIEIVKLFYGRVSEKWCKNIENNDDAKNCEKCIEEWLESEVKHNE